MPAPSLDVRQLAETIDLPMPLRVELACLALQVDEPWEEVVAEALSELRTVRGVCLEESLCDEEAHEQRDASTSGQPAAL